MEAEIVLTARQRDESNIATYSPAAAQLSGAGDTPKQKEY